MGGTGTGKTHIAIAPGTRLITNGKKAFGGSPGRIALAASLFNAVDLINAWIKEQADGNTGKISRQLSALGCIIIDEPGYTGLRPFASQTIPRMVCRCANRRPFPKPGPKPGGTLLF